MGNMVERMHNTSDREFISQKRRKLYDDRETDQKAHFSGRSGGVLGGYVRDKQEEGTREAAMNPTAKKVPVMDLTGADDDDVVVVKDEGDKEVCYGRVDGADFNAHHIPTPKPGSTSLNPALWPIIRVFLRRVSGDKTNVVHVVDSTRTIIGCLDTNTAGGLVPLLDSPLRIRTAARVLARARADGDLPPGAICSRRFALDLTIYGPRKFATAVGRHLSQKQVWLRQPMLVEAGREVINPHATIKMPTAPRTGYSSSSAGSGFSMRTVEEIRNDVIGMFDTLEQSENLPEIDPDPRIVTPLLSHQKQGLYFMSKKEQPREISNKECNLWRVKYGNNGQKKYLNVITGHEVRQEPPSVLGGILADMMGLGKTLSILSLVVGSLDQSEAWAKERVPAPKDDEIPLVRNVKTTLLVSPLSTITNWEEQIHQHIKPGTLKYYIYHGANRCKDIEKLADYDLIITTYGSVASEFSGRLKKKKEGNYPLQQINWFRVVLDEAHMIREQSTLQSKAICCLEAQRRWAVTGTPVQNRLDDLGALIKFLRVKPFDEKGGFSQFILAPCKNADPEILPKLRLLVDTITLRRLKDRIDLPARHDKLIKLQFSKEERELYDVFSKNAKDRVKVMTSQQEKSLSGRAYVHILQSILRLRLICAHGRELLSDEDLKIMEGLSESSAIDLDDEDDITEKPALPPKQAYDMFNLMRQTNADVCSSCNRKIGPQEVEGADGEPKDEIIGYMAPCFQIVCRGCFKDYKAFAEQAATSETHTICPLCQLSIRMSFFTLKQGNVEEDQDARADMKDRPKQSKSMSSYNGPHTKTRTLIEDLLNSKFESELKPDEPPIKSVVFSGWTSHLDLIQCALNDAGIAFTRLDGKMSRTARTAAMDTFRTDPSIPVILVSITAGGLGLNLTTANKVYVMEPQYNPAAEAQAIDRVHRLGQKREVETVRYIMEDSFEEKMLELQEKKRKLASLSMDRDGTTTRGGVDKAEAAKKRLEDLRSLFK
jgi:SNF2 family DNA or RNA helicase